MTDAISQKWYVELDNSLHDSKADAENHFKTIRARGVLTAYLNALIDAPPKVAASLNLPAVPAHMRKNAAASAEFILALFTSTVEAINKPDNIASTTEALAEMSATARAEEKAAADKAAAKAKAKEIDKAKPKTKDVDIPEPTERPKPKLVAPAEAADTEPNGEEEEEEEEIPDEGDGTEEIEEEGEGEEEEAEPEAPAPQPIATKAIKRPTLTLGPAAVAAMRKKAGGK